MAAGRYLAARTAAEALGSNAVGVVMLGKALTGSRTETSASNGAAFRAR